MEPEALLDTTVLLRHLLNDHPDQSRRATAYLKPVFTGERVIRLTDAVVSELVFTLERSYKVPRTAIHDFLMEFLELPAVVLPGKTLYRRILRYWLDQSGLAFTDCQLLIQAEHLGIGAVVTFDKKMSRYQGVYRVEP